jgi:hypothetical protein
MLMVVILVLAVLGAGAVIVMIYSATRILRLVAVADRKRVLGFLGRWEFGAVKHFGGAATVRHSNRYLNAMMVLLGAIACAAVLGAVTFISGQAGPSPDPSVGQLVLNLPSPSVLES